MVPWSMKKKQEVLELVLTTPDPNYDVPLKIKVFCDPEYLIKYRLCMH